MRFSLLHISITTIALGVAVQASPIPLSSPPTLDQSPPSLMKQAIIASPYEDITGRVFGEVSAEPSAQDFINDYTNAKASLKKARKELHPSAYSRSRALDAWRASNSALHAHQAKKPDSGKEAEHAMLAVVLTHEDVKNKLNWEEKAQLHTQKEEDVMAAQYRVTCAGDALGWPLVREAIKTIHQEDERAFHDALKAQLIQADKTDQAGIAYLNAEARHQAHLDNCRSTGCFPVVRSGWEPERVRLGKEKDLAYSNFEDENSLYASHGKQVKIASQRVTESHMALEHAKRVTRPGPSLRHFCRNR